MYCKKCGFKLNEQDSVCPFCKHNVNEDLILVNEKKEENRYFYKEEVKPKPSKEYVNINKVDGTNQIRTHLGYVNLNTQYWHHILIAGVGYLLMYILLILVGRSLVSNYVANGMDFSCVGLDGDMSSCPIEVTSAYVKITCIAQMVAELLVVGMVAALFYKYLIPFFKQFKDKNTWKWVGYGFLLMYGLTLVYTVILEVLQLSSTSANQDAVNETILNNRLLGFLFVVIAAPLFEELIFRFGVYRAFANQSKKREIVGIVITTILFAMVHMTATFDAVFADASNPNWELFKSDMLSLPTYFIGAFSLTYVYYKSKNLLTSMLMHMAWNFMAFIAILGSSAIEPSEVIINFIPNIIETLTRLF